MKYVAYYRVSTNKQSLGLDAQQKSVSDFISANNENILLGEFKEKESGKNDNRIELNKALQLCKKENATLIIAKLDRLSRKVSFLFNLRDSGVDFKSLDCPDFNTLTLGIFATLAQSERELISQRTKAALQVKKEQGFKLGNPNAYIKKEWREIAYQKAKEKADNNNNNKRSKLMIESLLKITNNKSEIARKLNENGFLTSNGNNFTATQVIRIIKRYNIKG